MEPIINITFADADISEMFDISDMSDKERSYLTKIADYLKPKPQMLDMDFWFSSKLAPARTLADARDLGECGTTACVAGWHNFLSRPEVIYNSPSSVFAQDCPVTASLRLIYEDGERFVHWSTDSALEYLKHFETPEVA